MDTVNRIKKLGKLTVRLTDFDCTAKSNCFCDFYALLNRGV